MAAQQVGADIILVDVGPNLGAINRSALIASDYVAIPLGADLFSLQGLKNLGPTLRTWREGWKRRLNNWKSPGFDLPLEDAMTNDRRLIEDFLPIRASVET